MIKKKNSIKLEFSFPFKNSGTQQAIVIDGVMRLEPEGDKYKEFFIESRVFNPDLPLYPDGYWEAFLVKPKKMVWLNSEITIAFKDGRDFTDKDIPEDIYFSLYYKYYGRTPIKCEKQEILVKPADFSKREEEGKKISEEAVEEKKRKPLDESIKSIAVKTHILRPHEDIIEILNKYALPLSEKGDIVAVAESVIAILQGRVFYIEDIRPGYFATRMNRFFKQDASLSSPYSLQMAIEEVGLWRIIIAFFMGVFGKLIGRSGDFYRVAGRYAATIDDPPGTMPPFDKCVVLCPKDPAKVAEHIKKETGLDAVIVDANDLGKVDVLGSTLSDNSVIVKALSHNPREMQMSRLPLF